MTELKEHRTQCQRQCLCVCVHAFHSNVILKHFSSTNHLFFHTGDTLFFFLYFVFDSGGWSHVSFCVIIHLSSYARPCNLACNAMHFCKVFRSVHVEQPFFQYLLGDACTASSGLISHRVCLTLPDTRATVWANCSNHKNPARRTGNTHTHTHLHAQTEGPFLHKVGREQWRCDQNTHTQTLTHTHMLGESEEEGNRVWGKQEQKVKKCQDVWRQMAKQKRQKFKHLSG